MLSSFANIARLMTRAEKRHVGALLILIMLSGLAEAVGVASIIPFLAVLADPGVIYEQELLHALYQRLGFTSEQSFLLFLGGGVFALVVLSLSVKASAFWAMSHFTQMRSYVFGTRLLKGYLGQPYGWFLGRHSADLGKNLLSEVEQVVTQVLAPGMRLIAQTVTVFFLICLIVWVSPSIAGFAALVLGICFAAIYMFLRKRLERIGEDRFAANQLRFKIAHEAFTGVKELKTANLEKTFLGKFAAPAQRYARHQANSQILRELPRFFMEGLAVGGMLTLILVLLSQEGGQRNLAAILPSLGVMAFAAIRMLPALQQMYQFSAMIRLGRASVIAVLKELQDVERSSDAPEVYEPAKGPPLRIQQQLIFDQITYRYPEANVTALQGITLTIPAKTTIGVIGTTGAGKSTLIDVLMGLLPPDNGQILVDGTALGPDNVRRWQKSIGYVPQDVFLLDDTISANIAFGVSAENIDHGAVVRAAEMAELDAFVRTNLPEGYDTRVGERGVRLSGGQRQRIGIARALYRQPDMLVMDEATSALDNITERSVMNAVRNLGGQKTIILIAHRLSTIRNADLIFFLKDGQVEASGTYDELTATNMHVRKLAEADLRREEAS